MRCSRYDCIEVMGLVTAFVFSFSFVMNAVIAIVINNAIAQQRDIYSLNGLDVAK
jgi:hypothetical protein